MSVNVAIIMNGVSKCKVHRRAMCALNHVCSQSCLTFSAVEKQVREADMIV